MPANQTTHLDHPTNRANGRRDLTSQEKIKILNLFFITEKYR